MKLEDLDDAVVLRNHMRNAMKIMDAITSSGSCFSIVHAPVETREAGGERYGLKIGAFISIDKIRECCIEQLAEFIVEKEVQLKALGFTLSNTEE